MTTRERIVETAISLFNERGTAAISTNHIAAAAEISPGNLYYYFRNKEEIIRAIFEQMDGAGLAQYEQIVAASGPGTLQAMRASFEMIQSFNWRYRFFKRELTSLVNADPLLKAAFIRTHRALRALVAASIHRSIEAGVLRPLAKRDRDLLAEEIWLITLFWPNYLEVGGEQVNAKTLRRGSALLARVLAPYLAPALSNRGQAKRGARQAP